jgi:diguanylate cyclase (GGDEF)-like protein
MVCVLWFTSVSESILWRGWAASAGAAVMFLIAANAIAKAKPYEMLDRITRLTFLSTALVLLARPLVSIIYEGSLHLEAEVPHSFWLVSFKVFAMLSWFATAMLFLLQITTDLMKELAGQSRTDPLTGIFNRRGFQAEADRLLPSASTSIPACLLLFDIDRFKTVNDSYGHAVGDAVILGMAEILRQRGDATGCAVGRLGGEEFAALLPVTTLVSARALAEDMRNAFRHRSHRGVPSSHSVTVSVGIAEYQQGESLDSLIERADVALYQAKRGGRDRVVIASPAPANPVALMQAGQLALG